MDARILESIISVLVGLRAAKAALILFDDGEEGSAAPL